MKKWVCKVCGYVHTGDNAPEICPQCKAKNPWIEEDSSDSFACQHETGCAQGLDSEVVQGLRDNYLGECSEVGMYIAMSRAADREGFPEIAEAFKRYAYEEADHAARFAEMLGEVLSPSTEKNVLMRSEAESGACRGKLELAKRAKELGYDAIHDSVHEMAKDEARHGAGFKGLLKRYFGK